MNETSTQSDVFDYVKRLTDPKRTAFIAYGDKGSGKTQTMSGGAWKDNGIIEKFIVEISRIINCLTSQNWNYKVSISMVQIYFSSLTDLFRKFLEPIPELRIKTESICPNE